MVDLAGSVAAAVVTSLSAAELRTAAGGILSTFKVPTVWWIVDSADAIPVGATGKPDKRRLREMLAASHDGVGP